MRSGREPPRGAGRSRPPRPVGDPRRVALNVIVALSEDEAFLQPALEAELRRAQLEPRDRGLARELTLGVARRRRRLERALEPLVRRGLDQTSPRLRAALLLGAYQLLFLDRVPAHAAVHGCVELARAVGGEGGARFVNGVLRGLQRAGEPPLGDPEDTNTWGARYSLPDWLLARWIATLGHDGARARAEAMSRPAPLVARVDAAALDRGGLIERLQAEGATARATRWAPDGVVIEGHAAPFDGASFREGAWRAQDEAAQLVACLAGPAPGDHVWDVCAAPGGKTRHLARLLGGRGALLATDVHVEKARRLADDLRDRPVVEVRAHDATTPLSGAPAFDVVVVDAPCTGLGVLRRHPEIGWRRASEDVAARAALQSRILEAVAPSVRPGGSLIYSVCTDTVEEGRGQIAAFLASHDDFALVGRADWPALDATWADVAEGDLLLTSPERHDADAFVAARLRRLT